MPLPIPARWCATERLITGLLFRTLRVTLCHTPLRPNPRQRSTARQLVLPTQTPSTNGLRGADCLGKQDRGALRASMASWWTRWPCFSGICGYEEERWFSHCRSPYVHSRRSTPADGRRRGLRFWPPYQASGAGCQAGGQERRMFSLATWKCSS